jgi:hypothetical protein
MDSLSKYYQLKQKYEESMNRRKLVIKKNKDLSIKEKKIRIKKLLGNCANCGKPGGTIFEEKNGMLKAVCGNKTPCDLNINLKRKLYDNIPDLEQKNYKASENLKMRIIMTKLDYLFGLVNSKDETVDKFNTLKNELSQINEKQMVIQKNYGDMISGIHREPLLLDATQEFVTEIAELKNIYQEYSNDPLPAYLTTMVEKYVTTIKPLTEKIRNMNYAYYAIETNIDEGNSVAVEGAEAGIVNNISSDMDINREKKILYTLVALPYRMDQLEQERK